MDRAKCRDMPHDEAMRLFFPEKGQQCRDGRTVCLGRPADGDIPCPVIEDCLTYALSFEPEGMVGIWGGTTHSERRKLYAEALYAKPLEVLSYRNVDSLGGSDTLPPDQNRGADTLDA